MMYILLLFSWITDGWIIKDGKLVPLFPVEGIEAESLPSSATFDSLTVKYWLNLMNNTTVVDNSGDLFMRKINSGSQFLDMMLGSTFYIDKYDNFSHARQDLTLGEYALRFWGGHQDSILYHFSNTGAFSITNLSNRDRMSLSLKDGICINGLALLNDTMLIFDDDRGDTAKLKFNSSITELFSNKEMHIWQAPNHIVQSGITLVDSGIYIGYSNAGFHTFSNFAVKNTEFVWSVGGIAIPIYAKLGTNGFEIRATHAHDTNRIYIDPDDFIKTDYALLDIGGGKFYLRDTANQDTLKIFAQDATTLLWKIISAQPISIESDTLIELLGFPLKINGNVFVFYEDSAYSGNLLPHTNAGYSIGNSDMRWFSMWTENYYGIESNSSDSFRIHIDNDTVVFWSTCPVRIDSLIGGGGNQGWTMGCGDTLIGISPDCADSFYLFDDGDTTRLISDNPIKIGESSFVVADSYNMSTKPLGIGGFPPTGLGWLEVLSEDTLKANAVYSLTSTVNPAINYNVFINNRSWFKSGIFVSVSDSISDTLSCIRISDMVNDGGVAIGLYASIPVIGAENPVWSIFVPSNKAPSHFGMVYIDSMQFTKIWGSCLTVTGNDVLCPWSIYVPPSPEGFPANISILYSDTIYIDNCKAETLRTDRLIMKNYKDSVIIDEILCDYKDSSLSFITSYPENDTFIINKRMVFIDTLVDTLIVGMGSVIYTYGATNDGDDRMGNNNRISQSVLLDTTGEWISHSLLSLQGDSVFIDSFKVVIIKKGSGGKGDSLKISLLKTVSAMWDSVIRDTFIDISELPMGVNMFGIHYDHMFKYSPKKVAINTYFWGDEGTAEYFYRGLIVYYKSYTFSELVKRQ